MTVVIALDEHQPQRAMRRAPRIERGEGFIGVGFACVQQVAEKHDRLRAMRRDKRIEPRQVVGRGARRHRNAARAKHGVFAEMRIGDEEALFERIECGSLGGEHERVAV